MGWKARAIGSSLGRTETSPPLKYAWVMGGGGKGREDHAEVLWMAAATSWGSTTTVWVRETRREGQGRRARIPKKRAKGNPSQRARR